MKKHLLKLSNFVFLPLLSLAAVSCSNNQNIPPSNYQMINSETGLAFNSNGEIINYYYYGTNDYTNIVIPEYLVNNHISSSEYFYGYKQRITSIYKSAFNIKYNEYAQYLTNITLPNSIEFIDAYVFSGTPLTEIILPDSIISIEEYTFQNCTNLTNVKLSKNTKHIGVGSFQGTAITSIEIPNTTLCIYRDAFRDTKLSGSLYIPDSVEWIYQGAFEGTEITEVSISRRCNYYLNGTFPENCKIITRL